MKYSNRSVLSRFGQEHSLSIQESHMHAGTFQSTATLTLEHPKRTSRYWVFGAVIVTSILAGCASRTTHAPVTDMSGGSRSEERRVGKECVSTGSSRWAPDH